jgi:hypothetical protein
MIHAADPELKNLVVLQSAPNVSQLGKWLEPMDIVCVRNVTFDALQAEELRKLGKEVWLYVSGPSPPYPTLAIDYPAMAYRVLPWMCWKFRVSGLLYWCVNYWTTNPYLDPMNTPWGQNGNGALYYPGPDGPVSSIRLEVLRDGMEDYEYLALLDALVRRVKADAVLAARPSVRDALGAAERLLAVDERLVESMRTYSKDPNLLDQQRRAIAEAIEALGEIVAGTDFHN